MKKLKLAFLGFVTLVGMALMPAAANANCQVGNCWGAVAYGPGGAWAYAVNFASRGWADRAARNNCRGRCTNVLTFHNSCGAYASGPYGYGWGNAPSRYQAEAIALQQCNARSPNCGVRVWGCTTR